MLRLTRPWAQSGLAEDVAFGPADCLLGEAKPPLPQAIERAALMRSVATELWLHPYPRQSAGSRPERQGFPVRPREGHEPKTPEEAFAHDALGRMNEVLARIQELEEALDEPARLWPRLREAWTKAENEADPRMAEIVRQAREIQPTLRELERRVRRVLRRTRELTPLDRVQEMDRASMLWLVRQPGRSMAERAGPGQRIHATVRHENFDVLENRVLRAYAILAADVAREWLREHPRAKNSRRFAEVEAFRRICRVFAAMLDDLGVGIATPGITPNYVLMQDRSYRSVFEAWQKLLRRGRILDDLWAWQAQTWTDFAVLAIVLALDGLDEAELVAQSPVLWRAEAVTGRWFEQDRPLAVFWLRETGRIVEVLSRPENPEKRQMLARAHVSLRISDPRERDLPRRVVVWTPHAMQRLDLPVSADEARLRLDEIQQVSGGEILRDGLILTPGHGTPEIFEVRGRRTRVTGIALDASGDSLGVGLRELAAYVRSDIYRGEA
jgi:hypothetical protein